VANQCADSTCASGSVSVLLGNGDGTFQAAVSYSSGGYTANSVAIGDVNGDGHPDLVVANECQSNNCSGGFDGVLGVLLGNGDGTFQGPVSYSSGGYVSSSVAIADINGDGRLDLTMASYAQSSSSRRGSVSVLPGNGDGTFQAPVSFSSGGDDLTSVAIADVNGDGKPDAIAANGCLTRGCTNGGVGVLLNNLIANTTTEVTSSPNPSQVDQSVTFTATVTSNPLIADGEVITFHLGKTTIGTGVASNGVATLTTSFSEPKTYTIKATYPGDAFHKSSMGTMKQVVNP